MKRHPRRKIKQAMLPQLIEDSDGELIRITVVPISNVGCIICIGEGSEPVCWLDRYEKLDSDKFIEQVGWRH